MDSMFKSCSKLTNLDVSKFNTSNVANMYSMFGDCSSLTSLDVSNFNTSKVTNMYYMFSSCSSLTSLDVSNFDTSNVTDMSWMFNNCSKLTNLDVSNFNTNKVTDMDSMFKSCSKLTNLDVSNFNTSNVTRMTGMFSGCSALTSLDLSNFNTSNVTDMHFMFNDCSSLTSLDLSNFDTSKVIDMGSMFRGCSSLTSLKLCSFDTSKVTNMNYMFGSTSKLTKIYVGPKWTTANATTTNMFNNSGVSAVTQSDTCELDAYGIVINNISFSATVNSITLVTDASSKSGSITKYEFSKDNGKTWINNGSNNTYEFTGLTKNTDYKLMVRVTNSNNQTATKSINVTTESIAAPTYTEVKNDDSSDVTIDFGVDCSNGTYTCSYQKDNGSSVNVTTSTATVHFTNSGSLVAKITAGAKTVSSSYTVKLVSLMMARDTSKAFWQSTYQGKISTVDVLDNKNVPSTVVASWDVSEKQNKSIMAWIIDDPNNSGMYKLYIGGDGGVAAPINSSNLFDGYKGSFSKTKTMNLTNLDTSRVTNMSTMFRNCISLTSLDLSSFDTSNVTSMHHMFSSCSSLTDLNLSNFKTNNVTDMNYMFDNCSSLTNLDVSKFNTSNVANMYSMFGGCSSLTSLDVSNFITSKVTNMNSMFNGCSSLTNLDVSNFDTSNVTDMSNMFYKCGSLTNLDVSNFDTSKVTNMEAMFAECSSLTNLDASNFNTSKVTNMNGMFFMCSSLTDLDVSNFDTSKVTNMNSMFGGCKFLTSLDVSKFNTSNVADMYSMFSGCSSLTNLDLSNFDTSKITDMRWMFSGCSSLTSLDVSKFNTSNVADMGDMFYNCKSLTNLKLCSFDTSQVTSMSYMFGSTSKLTKVYVGPKWTTANATTDGMFTGSGVSAVTQSNTCEFDAEEVNVDISTTSTNNSITVVANASADSGIAKYEFSKDDGKTWVDNGASNTYTFNSLLKDTYYKIDVRATSNLGKTGYGTSTAKYSVPTNSLLFWGSSSNKNNTTSILKDKSGKNKDGKLNNFNNTETSGYKGGELVFDGSNDFVDIGYANYDFKNSISYVIYAKIDSSSSKQEYFGNWEGGGGGLGYENKAYVNFYNGSTYAQVNAPSDLNHDKYYAIIGTYDGSNIKLYLNGSLVGTVASSKITSTGVPIFIGANPGSNNSFLYPTKMNLKEAMLFDRALTQTEVSDLSNYFMNSDVRTLEMAPPAFKEEDNSGNGKKVVITYPDGCGSTLTCSYQKDSDTEVQVTSKTATVYFTDNGSVVAKVLDGTNDMSSSYNVLMTDYYVSSTGSDLTGNGTISKPLASIKEAYNRTKSESTIHLMSDIGITEKLVLKDSKKITLTSYNGTYSLIRNSSFIDGSMVDFENGTLTLKNIVLNGNSAQSTGSLIYTTKTLNINDNVTLKNGYSSQGIRSGGITIEGGQTNISGNSINISANTSSQNTLYNNIIVISGTLYDSSKKFTTTTNTYSITSALNNNLRIDVANATSANGTNVQMYTSNSSNAQKWKVMANRIENSNIIYNFQSQIDGSQYLWISNNSSTSGTNILTWSFHYSHGGHYYISSVGNDYYEFKNIDGLCVDASGNSSGANVWGYTCNKTNAQKWKFVKS